MYLASNRLRKIKSGFRISNGVNKSRLYADFGLDKFLLPRAACTGVQYAAVFSHLNKT